MTPVIGMLTASTPWVRFCANANLDTKEVALNANVSDDVSQYVYFISVKTTQICQSIPILFNTINCIEVQITELVLML